MIFRESLAGDSRHAYDLARTMIERLYARCPFHCLDIAAALAWLDMRRDGRLSELASRWLLLFDSLKAYGKKELLTVQGFLTPNTKPNIGRTIGVGSANT